MPTILKKPFFPLSPEFKTDLYKYVKFIIGGGLSLCLNLLLTYILTEQLHLWYMLSFGTSLIIEILFLFIYHSKITFQKHGAFFKFALLILFISALNWGYVYFLTELFNIYYLIAIILAALTISILNYFLNKKIVFR